jgi:hypothetical protein
MRRVGEELDARFHQRDPQLAAHVVWLVRKVLALTEAAATTRRRKDTTLAAFAAIAGPPGAPSSEEMERAICGAFGE